MHTNNSSHGKQARRSEPSFWPREPANDAPPLIEDILRGDELGVGPSSLREENARLRKLAVQLSNLVGDLPVD